MSKSEIVTLRDFLIQISHAHKFYSIMTVEFFLYLVEKWFYKHPPKYQE